MRSKQFWKFRQQLIETTMGAELLQEQYEELAAVLRARVSPPSPVLSAEASDASTPLRECWITYFGDMPKMTLHKKPDYKPAEGWTIVHMREVGADRGGQ